MVNFSTMDVAGFGHQVGENCNEADDFTIKKVKIRVYEKNWANMDNDSLCYQLTI